MGNDILIRLHIWISLDLMRYLYMGGWVKEVKEVGGELRAIILTECAARSFFFSSYQVCLRWLLKNKHLTVPHNWRPIHIKYYFSASSNQRQEFGGGICIGGESKERFVVIMNKRANKFVKDDLAALSFLIFTIWWDYLKNIWIVSWVWYTYIFIVIIKIGNI